MDILVDHGMYVDLMFRGIALHERQRVQDPYAFVELPLCVKKCEKLAEMVRQWYVYSATPKISNRLERVLEMAS